MLKKNICRDFHISIHPIEYGDFANDRKLTIHVQFLSGSYVL